MVEAVEVQPKKGGFVHTSHAVGFDTETTGAQFAGEDRLRLTVAVAWSSRTKCLHAFKEDELGHLAALLDTADVIIAHNSTFDFKVMELYFNKARVDAWRKQAFDPFEVICQKEGTWAGLGPICEVNNRPTKTSSGIEAIVMWNEGRVKQLTDYCAMDVWIMIKLLEYDTTDEWFWFCQKRSNRMTKLQDHIGAGRVNKRTLEVVMAETQGAFPPGYEGKCPCIKRNLEVLQERKRKRDELEENKPV
jgi:hypothetical protein